MLKEIEGFEGYRIDGDGDVWSCFQLKHNLDGKGFQSIKTNRWKKLKHHIIYNNYHQVTLYKNRKPHRKLVHRLLAKAFIPNPSNKPCVLHQDGNNQNNSLDNLYWGTQKDNMRDAVRHGTHPGFQNKGEKQHLSKLNEKQVRVIRHIVNIPNHISQELIGKIFNVRQSTIARIASGQHWKHIKI